MAIEEPEAVENVGGIAAVKGIDVLMIGPSDLMLRSIVRPKAFKIAALV